MWSTTDWLIVIVIKNWWINYYLVSGEIYNIGSDFQINVLELAKTLVQKVQPIRLIRMKLTSLECEALTIKLLILFIFVIYPDQRR